MIGSIIERSPVITCPSLERCMLHTCHFISLYAGKTMPTKISGRVYVCVCARAPICLPRTERSSSTYAREIAYAILVCACISFHSYICTHLVNNICAIIVFWAIKNLSKNTVKSYSYVLLLYYIYKSCQCIIMMILRKKGRD